MREITILAAALVETRRMMAVANTPLPTDTLTTRINRIIATSHEASSLLLRAKAESQIASAATLSISKSLHAK